jgi:hypothetical protein
MAGFVKSLGSRAIHGHNTQHGDQQEKQGKHCTKPRHGAS